MAYVIKLTEAEANTIGYALADKLRTTKANLRFMEQRNYSEENKGLIKDLIEKIKDAQDKLENGTWETD